MTALTYQSAARGLVPDRATRSQPPTRRPDPMTGSLPFPRRRSRQHHGTLAEQLDALDRGLTEMAELAAQALADADAARRENEELLAVIARVAEVADGADAKANFLAAAFKSVTENERRRGETGPDSLLDRKGFPGPCHPESMDAELPGADEEWLAALAAALWPTDEYVAEIIDPSGGTP
jgi:hypothetical protein